MSGVPVVTDFGPDSGGRIKGLTIIKPLVVGNVAKYFGKKREEDGHTHQWTVYVRPFENIDYSTFIKKVQFKLHDSYANPARIVTQPPYEVTETGWGEFEITVRIYFNDPTERPITLCHVLKLFRSGTDPTTENLSKKPLVTESYDEIIFQEPTALMKSLLDDIKPLTNGPYFHETNFDEKEALSREQIQHAKSIVRNEIQAMKEKLELAKTTITNFKAAIATASAKGESSQFAVPTSPTKMSEMAVPPAVVPMEVDSPLSKVLV